MKPTNPSDRSAFLARVLNDFDAFLRELFIDRGLDRKAPIGEVEADLAAFGEGTGFKSRRVILAFRGCGKTHLITAGLTCYRLLRDPDRKVIIVSKSLDAAKKTIRLIRQWFDQVWFLRHLAPLDGQRDAATYLDAGPAREDRQPSVTAIGIGGPLENNRAHTIIGDDVETKANTRTVEARQRLADTVCEFANILYPDRPGLGQDPVEIVHVGTPKHADTLFLTLQKREYHIRSYPIQLPAPDQQTIALAPILQARLNAGEQPGTPTCPHRFGPAEIAVRMAEGVEEFAREFLLIADAADASTHPLRLRDLIVLAMPRDEGPLRVTWGTVGPNGSTRLPIRSLGLGDDALYGPAFTDEHTAPYHATKCWIDPAGMGSDQTAFAIGSSLNGLIFVKAVVGLPGGHSTADMDHMIVTGREHGVTEFYIESTADTLHAYRHLFASRLPRHFLRRGEDSRFPQGWQASLIDDTKLTHSTTQKEERIIAALRPVTQAHRLIIHPQAITPAPGEDRATTLQYQFTHIANIKGCLGEDGKLDALAGLVRLFSRTLRADPKKAAAVTRLRQFMPSARPLGPRTAGPPPVSNRPVRFGNTR